MSSRYVLLLLLVAGAIALGIAGNLLWRRPQAAQEPSLASQTGTGAPAAQAPASGPDSGATDQIRDISTSAELAALLAKHPGPAVLEFHAAWCQPCQKLAPLVEAAARRHPDLLVLRIDAVAASTLANSYEVETLPLLVRMQGTAELRRKVGLPSAGELELWLFDAAGATTGVPAHGGFEEPRTISGQ